MFALDPTALPVDALAAVEADPVDELLGLQQQFERLLALNVVLAGPANVVRAANRGILWAIVVVPADAGEGRPAHPLDTFGACRVSAVLDAVIVMHTGLARLCVPVANHVDRLAVLDGRAGVGHAHPNAVHVYTLIQDAVLGFVLLVARVVLTRRTRNARAVLIAKEPVALPVVLAGLASPLNTGPIILAVAPPLAEPAEPVDAAVAVVRAILRSLAGDRSGVLPGDPLAWIDIRLDRDGPASTATELQKEQYSEKPHDVS